jgi:hypothetical protein
MLDALAIGVSATVPFLLNEATKPGRAPRAEALGTRFTPGTEQIGVATEVLA